VIIAKNLKKAIEIDAVSNVVGLLAGLEQNVISQGRGANLRHGCGFGTSFGLI